MMKRYFLLVLFLFFLISSLVAQQGSAIKLSGRKELFTDVKFSPTQDKILIGSTGNWSKLWDLKSNIITVYKHPAGVNAVTFSPDGLTFATACKDNNAYLWKITKASMPKDTFASIELKYDYSNRGENGVRAVAISKNGKSLATGSFSGSVRVWDISEKAIVGRQALEEDIDKLAFSPDGSVTMIGEFGMHNFMNFPGKTNRYTDLKYSTDGSFAALAFRPIVSLENLNLNDIRDLQKADPGSSCIYRFDTKTLIELEAGDPTVLAISADDQYIAVGERNGKISLFDVSGKLLYRLGAHKGKVLSISFSSDSKRFVTSAEDGLIKLWEVGKESYLAELHPSGEADKLFTIVLPSGHYFNSGRQVDGIIIDGESYSFNDTDLRFHRPDLVMKELGYASSGKIARYEKVYKKRISLLNLADRQVNPLSARPKIEVDRSEVRRYSLKKEVSFRIKASSENEELATLLVKVNGIPVNGRKGLAINGKAIEKTVTVQLNNGKNSISSEVITKSGRTSLRKEFLVVYESDKKLPNLYFVGIGSGKFGLAKEDELGALNAASDIQSLQKAYQRRKGVLFEKMYSKMLVDDEVTVENVLQLKSWLKNTDVDDLVIFFYTGHGILKEEQQAYYLSTYNVQVENPEVAGLNYDSVEDLLDNIPARKKLVMINACNSGEYDKDRNTFKMMKKTFVDLREHSGAFVISSSTSYNNSYGQQVGDSEKAITVFTNGLLKVFADYDQVHSNEIMELLYDVLGKQKPTIRRENIMLNFRIW